MFKLLNIITEAYSPGTAAIKHPRVYEVRTHSCGFNTSLSQNFHLKTNGLCKTNGRKLTCTVICKTNITVIAVKHFNLSNLTKKVSPSF